MAGQNGKFVMKDGTVVVNGVDLSNRASQVTVNMPDDDVDMSSFQGGHYKEWGKGLSDASIDVQFFIDYQVGKVDDTLWPLKTTDTTFKMYCTPFQGAVAQNNPMYGLDARMFNYSPLTGQIGQAATTTVTFRNGSAYGITKGITPTDLANFLART